MNVLLSIGLLFFPYQFSSLAPNHQRLVDQWLRSHQEYRIARDEDCDCAEDLATIRRGSGGIWKPDPQYRPYYRVGDFNGDGRTDFAVAVIGPAGETKPFVILIFNGPFAARSAQFPSFVSEARDLKYYRYVLWSTPSTSVSSGCR